MQSFLNQNFGSILVAITSILTLLITTKSLSRRNKNEREFSLKRDAFLKVIDSFTRALGLIGSMADRPTKDFNSAIAETGTEQSIAPLNLLVKNETIEKVYKFQVSFLRITTKLVIEKLKIERIENELPYKKSELDRMEKICESLVTNAKDNNDRTQLDIILKEYERSEDEMRKLHQEYFEQFNHVTNMKLELLDISVKYFSELNPILSEVYYALRNELGISANKKEFENLQIEYNQQSYEIYSSLMADLRNTFNKDEKTK